MGNLQGVASEAGRGRDGAWYRAGLAILQAINPVRVPTAKHRVEHFAGLHKVPPPAEWQFIDSAEMHDLADVEIAASEVLAHSKTGQVRRAVIAQRRRIQNIDGIGKTTGPGEVGEDIQALAESALIAGLHRVIVAVSSEPGVSEPRGEIRIRNVVSDVQAGRKHLPGAVGVGIGTEMMNRVSDVAQLYGVVAGQGVLQGQIVALRIGRRHVVVLARKGLSARLNSGRSKGNAGQTG